MSRIYAISHSSVPVIRPIPPPSQSPVRTARIAANISMPLQVQASIGFAEPNGSRHSKLTMEGTVVLPGISAQLTFARKSREGRAQSESLTREIMLVGSGEWLIASSSTPPIQIARDSPVQIQIRDSSGMPLAEACHLGRCEDAPLGFGLSIRVPTTLVAEITTDSTVGSDPSPRTTIGGRLIFGRGIVIRCMFGSGEESSGGRLFQMSKADIIAVEAGNTVHFPDQLVEPSEPAGSLRRMTLCDGQGSPFTTNGLHSA